MVRQVDSSLLDEWEQLANPEEETAEEAQERADQVKPVTANARAFRVLVRNAHVPPGGAGRPGQGRRAGRAGRRVRLGRGRLGARPWTPTGTSTTTWAPAPTPAARSCCRSRRSRSTGCGGSGRPSPTRTATTTGASRAEVDLAASDEEGRAVVRVTDVGQL